MQGDDFARRVRKWHVLREGVETVLKAGPLLKRNTRGTVSGHLGDADAPFHAMPYVSVVLLQASGTGPLPGSCSRTPTSSASSIDSPCNMLF